MIIKTYSTGSHGNLHSISDGVTTLLLDCGLPFSKMSRLLGSEMANVSGILLSHIHKDHSKGAEKAMAFGFDLFTSKGTADLLGTSHRINVVKPETMFAIGTFLVIPFLLEHDVENIGFFISSRDKSAVYITDTAFVRNRFAGLTHIVVECNYDEVSLAESEYDISMVNRIKETHFGLANVKDFLSANDLSKIEEIRLVHLSDNNSNETIIRREIAELTGLNIVIPPVAKP